MKHMKISLTVAILFIFLQIARGQDAKDKLAAVKASLVGSQALLRQYEWIETSIVSVKNEEKARTVNRCYYGDDGKVQKVPVVAPPPEEKKRGLRGRIAEKKREEMTEYMAEAVALVKMYAPPDPARLQAAQASGNLVVQAFPESNQVRLTFTDYLKKRDSLILDIDAKNDRLTGTRVATYIDSDKEPVTMNASFDTLHDTIVYPARIVLDAKGKNLSVVVENSGYRKIENK